MIVNHRDKLQEVMLISGPKFDLGGCVSLHCLYYSNCRDGILCIGLRNHQIFEWEVGSDANGENPLRVNDRATMTLISDFFNRVNRNIAYHLASSTHQSIEDIPVNDETLPSFETYKKPVKKKKKRRVTEVEQMDIYPEVLELSQSNQIEEASQQESLLNKYLQRKMKRIKGQQHYEEGGSAYAKPGRQFETEPIRPIFNQSPSMGDNSMNAEIEGELELLRESYRHMVYNNNAQEARYKGQSVPDRLQSFNENQAFSQISNRSKLSAPPFPQPLPRNRNQPYKITEATYEDDSSYQHNNLPLLPSTTNHRVIKQDFSHRSRSIPKYNVNIYNQQLQKLLPPSGTLPSNLLPLLYTPSHFQPVGQSSSPDLLNYPVQPRQFVVASPSTNFTANSSQMKMGFEPPFSRIKQAKKQRKIFAKPQHHRRQMSNAESNNRVDEIDDSMVYPNMSLLTKQYYEHHPFTQGFTKMKVMPPGSGITSQASLTKFPEPQSNRVKEKPIIKPIAKPVQNVLLAKPKVSHTHNTSLLSLQSKDQHSLERHISQEKKLSVHERLSSRVNRYCECCAHKNGDSLSPRNDQHLKKGTDKLAYKRVPMPISRRHNNSNSLSPPGQMSKESSLSKKHSLSPPLHHYEDKQVGNSRLSEIKLIPDKVQTSDFGGQVSEAEKKTAANQSSHKLLEGYKWKKTENQGIGTEDKLFGEMTVQTSEKNLHDQSIGGMDRSLYGMKDEATSQLGSEFGLLGGRSIQATNTTSEANLLKNKPQKLFRKDNTDPLSNRRDWAESELYKHVFEEYLKEYMEANQPITAIAPPDEQMSHTRNAADIANTGKPNISTVDRLLNPQQLPIYTEMETTYTCSILKKKSTLSKQAEFLNEVFGKAKNTLSVLSGNLIAQDVSNDRVFEYYLKQTYSVKIYYFTLEIALITRKYIQSHYIYQEDGEQQISVKRENAIKMLLRCKKMYEARAQVRRVLKMIIKKEREVDVWLYNLDKISQIAQKEKPAELRQPLSDDEAQGKPNGQAKLIREGKSLIIRLQSMISTFLEEHKIFKTKDKFLFKGKDLQETLRDDLRLLEEHMSPINRPKRKSQIKGIPMPGVQVDITPLDAALANHIGIGTTKSLEDLGSHQNYVEGDLTQDAVFHR